MKKTREEVEKLKTDWLMNPSWDLCNVSGFDEYLEELFEFQNSIEMKSDENYIKDSEQEKENLTKLKIPKYCWVCGLELNEIGLGFYRCSNKTKSHVFMPSFDTELNTQSLDLINEQ